MDILVDASVIISRKDGSKFKIVPMNEKKAKGKSPFEGIKGVKAKVTTQELVEIIREGREGSEYIKKRY